MKKKSKWILRAFSNFHKLYTYLSTRAICGTVLLKSKSCKSFLKLSCEMDIFLFKYQTFSFSSLSFLFVGVYVDGTVIHEIEQNHKL